jgi:CRISPR-associated protein Cas1
MLQPTIFLENKSMTIANTDQDGRASLVYDLMEPLRPVVDKIIFSWVALQRWRRADFVIDRQRVIRVYPQLARIVVIKAMLPEQIIREEINAYLKSLKLMSKAYLGESSY